MSFTLKGRKRKPRKPKYTYFVDGKSFDTLAAAAAEYRVTRMTISNWCNGKKTNCWKEPITEPEEKTTETKEEIEVVETNISPPQSITQSGADGSDCFETAEDYLLAVVQGRTFPDSVRVSAARCMMQYQIPKKRLKAETPSPKKLRSKEAAEIEKHNILEFEQKAAKVRAKYKAKQGAK